MTVPTHRNPEPIRSSLAPIRRQLGLLEPASFSKGKGGTNGTTIDGSRPLRYPAQLALATGFAVLVATAWLTAAPAYGQSQAPDPMAVRDAVEDELTRDPQVPENAIGIENDNGIITLTGMVSNILAKERAERIAETVKGVRVVVNETAVCPLGERTPEEVTRSAEVALDIAMGVEDQEIAVSTSQTGEVTLTGQVDSFAEKQLAIKALKQVSGVTGVNDQLAINYAVTRPDQEIRQEIDQRLRWNVLVDDAAIDVSVDNGHVTLSGVVGSAAEKERARELAWVIGVHKVRNDRLNVEGWAKEATLRGDKYADRPPAEIETAVKAALRHDPAVTMPEDLTVEVTEAGIATQRGQVGDLAAKRSAEATARNTVGVVGVDNRLKVEKTKDMQPAETAQRVADALARHPYIERYDVSVTASNGSVRLSGTVDFYYEKAAADNVAAQVEGVQNIENNLIVLNQTEPYLYDPYVDTWPAYRYGWCDYRPGYTWATDREIKEEINDEMWWSPFVDSNDVNVSVEQGIATLTGTVDSPAQMEAARENAFEGGATWVINRLDIADQAS